MKTEDLGFHVLASYESKMSFAEGATLLGGVVVAAGLGFLGASESRAEKGKKPSKKDVETYRNKVRKIAVVRSLKPALEGTSNLWEEFETGKQYAYDFDEDFFDQCFSDDDLIADAIRAGITPEEAEKLGPSLELVPDDPTEPNYAKKVQGLKRMTVDNDVVDWINHFGEKIEEDDLAVLADLPEHAFWIDKIFVFKTKGPTGYKREKGVDWEQTLANIKYIDDLPQEVLDWVVPRPSWLEAWLVDEMPNVYKVAALREFLEKSDSGRILLSYINNLYFGGPLNDEMVEVLDRSISLLKEGTFPKLINAIAEYEKSGPGASVDMHGLLQSILILSKHGDELGPWNSYGDLLGAYDKLTSSHALDDDEFDDDEDESENQLAQVEVQERGPARSDARFFDRYAQLHPEWAIEKFDHEYKRGRRIAPLMQEVVAQVEKMVRDGNDVVVHGRDGELIYTMLTQIPGLDLSKVHYAITSRPLTTDAKGVSGRFINYLRRSIPKNAIHIDTGFEGSIPRWLDNRGFEVKSIKMVSANRPEEQIESTIDDKRLRTIVLADLEHSSQRLRTPSSFDKMPYSKGAPGYWARYFGVRDALKLPRFAVQGTTRFEKQRFRANQPEPVRFRIAPEPEKASREAQEDEDIETLVKKKL